jgi:pseudouridine-5'-phosphate glycosidase
VTGAFLVLEEVASALAVGRPVVALETSVIGQGLPHPRNLECIERMDGAIRDAGAVPAWIGVAEGAVRVGVPEGTLRRFAEPGSCVKVARRDLAAAVADGALGATTVSATIWSAHRAGIAIGATGGIGGVHPGELADVSADLPELGRVPVLLVCSGPKSIVDPLATLERLEAEGVAVVGYGVDRLPFFLATDAGVSLDARVDGPAEAAAHVAAQQALGTPGAILVVNPVPPAFAMDPGEVAAASALCQARAEAERVTGKEVTPFLLGCLAEVTEGRSLEANLALLEDNARVAAEIAVAVADR